ncbi:hypothetical protein CesoFtcFv8_013038 [Champsocephalus esox]|uniref:Uncharacterized protein n=1 Tax=Champsocephalus esox TaxID=159716 RepID=A0AAN8GUJ2_9TELE|nr:hypothetical protein CesoFtcFv8_013038 [Champsocephalus esox]
MGVGWGSRRRTQVGAGAFLADAVGLVWEMTEQTGARVASPNWHQCFVPTNPLQKSHSAIQSPVTTQHGLGGHEMNPTGQSREPDTSLLIGFGHREQHGLVEGLGGDDR